MKGMRPFTFRLVAAVALALSDLMLPAGKPPPKAALIPVAIREGSTMLNAHLPADTATVGEALARAGIEADNALVLPAPTSPLRPNMTMTILQAHTVTIRDGNEPPRTMTTFASTVGAAIGDVGLALGALDRITPPPTAILTPETTIVITRINEEDRRTEVEIPFTVSVTDDPTLPFGREKVLRPGTPGRAEEFVRVRTENGSVVSRVVLRRKMLQEPVPEERVRGTKITIGDVDTGFGVWGYYAGCMCAASPKYPRGTFVRVMNLSNGASVIVRINDYYDPRVDPHYNPANPRLIDLDAPAFRKLAPLWKGVIPVRVEEIL